MGRAYVATSIDLQPRVLTMHAIDAVAGHFRMELKLERLP